MFPILLPLRYQFFSLINLYVTVGLHNISSPDDHTVEFAGEDGLFSVVIHENYNYFTNENDIAIITLNRKVTFNQFVRPICLLSVAEDKGFVSSMENTTVFIAGRLLISLYLLQYQLFFVVENLKDGEGII